MAELGVSVTNNGPLFYGNETVELTNNQLRLPPRSNFTEIAHFQGFPILLPHPSAPRIIFVPNGVNLAAEALKLELDSCLSNSHRCAVIDGAISLHKKLLECAQGVIDSRGQIALCGGGRYLALWNSEDWARYCEVLVNQQQQQQ